jgi:NDP-sugar pyrophosphorylase family protein
MEKKLSPPKNNSNVNIVAIILCAGEGTRISNFVKNLPKPLLKVNDKPILSYLIFNLIKSNIKSIIIIIGHLSEEIEKYISSFKQENDPQLSNINIINASPNYKKGPLYSFLSITKKIDLINKDSVYLILPGDTFFESNLFHEFMDVIYDNFDFIKNNSIIFYQKIEGRVLKNTSNPNKLISIVKIKKKKSKELVKEIRSISLSKIRNKQKVLQIIPLFVFNYDLIKRIIETEKVLAVYTIKEVLNYIIKKQGILYAFAIKPTYRFFDIDTKSDLMEI